MANRLGEIPAGALAVYYAADAAARAARDERRAATIQDRDRAIAVAYAVHGAILQKIDQDFSAALIAARAALDAARV